TTWHPGRSSNVWPLLATFWSSTVWIGPCSIATLSGPGPVPTFAYSGYALACVPQAAPASTGTNSATSRMRLTSSGEAPVGELRPFQERRRVTCAGRVRSAVVERLVVPGRPRHQPDPAQHGGGGAHRPGQQRLSQRQRRDGQPRVDQLRL